MTDSRVVRPPGRQLTDDIHRTRLRCRESESEVLCELFSEILFCELSEYPLENHAVS